MKDAKRGGSSFAILFLDLDGFKLINDTYGHEAEDSVLKEIAERMQQTISDTNMVARFNGDEFLVLVPNSHEENVTMIAHRLMYSISQPLSCISSQANVTSSIGISIYPQDGNTKEDLIHHADVAMYEAKNSGKNQYHFHNNSNRSLK